MKKICLWFMAVCLLICSSIAAVACKGGKDDATTQIFVELSETKVSMEIYSQYTLTATANTNDEVVWTTSNEAVATVEDGVINALTIGATTITATVGGASASCAVTVTDLASFPDLVLSDTTLELVEGGDSYLVGASVSYKGVTMDCEFAWTTANPSIATVENGVVTPVGIGTTTISVTTECKGEILTKDITVIVNVDEHITVTKGEMSLVLETINAGEITKDTFAAEAYVKGVLNTAATLLFESSNEEVATVVGSGKEATVTAVGAGECQINVYYDSQYGRIQSSVQVTVSRSQVILDEMIKLGCKGAETVLNVSDLGLAGDFEGGYFNGKMVIAANGAADEGFVETNKGSVVSIELRTSVAVYTAKLRLAILTLNAPVVLGDDRVAMPTYQGNTADIGFKEGLTVYALQNTITNPDNVYDDGWYKRAIIPATGAQDYITIEFVSTKDITEEVFHVWGENGVPSMLQIRVDTGVAAGGYITNMDGSAISSVKAGTHYLVHIACKGLIEIQVGLVSCETTVYFSNITYMEGALGGQVGPNVSQGDARKPMPTYDGDATALGFPAGTKTVYSLVSTAATAWDQRIVMDVDSSKDYVKFDFISTATLTHLTMWPENSAGTQGSYTVTGQGGTTSDADPNRTMFIVDANGATATSIAANKLYTVYFYLKDEVNVQCSSFIATTLYIANIECADGDPAETPDIAQGESRRPMPTYSGDVTALGFAAGTEVYEIVGPQSTASDVKLVAKVDATGDNAYAKFDFVFSQATTSFGLWITAANVHLGYYTITPTSFTTTDSHGDPNREIFVTDANGNSVTSFAANKVYTLYIGLDGREVTVQTTTWANLTMYVANVACITEAEAPTTPVPPVQGKSISILFIGNSFSDDTEAYMVDILLNLGYTDINIGNLYIGGCSIDTHYSNIKSNASAYDFRMRSHNGKKYTEYETVTVGGEKKSIAFAIAYKNWDVISVQQASHESGQADSYNNLNALVQEVRKQATNKDVEIVFNMTWAYQADATHPQFPVYGNNQMTMYTAIVNAVQSKVEYTVVPNGTAIQNARTSLLGDTLTRDGYHLNLQIGRFIAGLTFVIKVTGADLDDLTYMPGGVNEVQFAIALESVQNALDNPFAITESEIQDEAILNPDITAGGSNATAVTLYRGDETALGFAEGTTVYQFVGVDSSADRASIKVDSTKYDYVQVQFVIAKGDGYFFMHGLKGGNWHNNGASYVVDPGWIRLGDGNDTPSDRVIEIYDAAGNKVTTLMKTNVLYTLRVYIKVGELDEIRISKAGSTIYFANVKQGVEGDDELTSAGIMSQGKVLPLYKGDVTALGFAAGTTVYEQVQDNRSSMWSAGSNLGLTMEQQTILLNKTVDEEYASVQFSLSRTTTSTFLFTAWWIDSKGENKGLVGYLKLDGTMYQMTDGFKIFVYDMQGYPVTKFEANTAYELRFYGKDAVTFKVGCCEENGQPITVYYAKPSSGNGLPTVKTDLKYSNDGNHTGELVSAFAGDVTTLGFAAGTTVYEQKVADGWVDRVGVNVDNTYDYVDIEFAFTEETTFCIWFNDESSILQGNYTVDMQGEAVAQNNAAQRKVQIVDENGNVVTALECNKVYKLRVYVEGLVKVQLSTYSGARNIYYGNVSFGNDTAQA